MRHHAGHEREQYDHQPPTSSQAEDVSAGEREGDLGGAEAMTVTEVDAGAVEFGGEEFVGPGDLVEGVGESEGLAVFELGLDRITFEESQRRGGPLAPRIPRSRSHRRPPVIPSPGMVRRSDGSVNGSGGQAGKGEGSDPAG